MNRDAKLRAMKRITAELVRVGGLIAWTGVLDPGEREEMMAHYKKRVRACRERLEGML